jgi:hypothetical protein
VAGGSLLLLEQVLQSTAIDGPDFLSYFVKQVEDSESLLGGPASCARKSPAICV